MLRSLCLLLAATNAVRAATADQWRSRSIYQVLTDRFGLVNGSTTSPCDPSESIYCGGSWQGIINKLDYIQDMGFDAIWISPVTSQVPNDTSSGEAYHGFWPNNMNELNSNFGAAADLKALSAALHSRGMYLMVDVVVNQMASAGTVSDIDFSTLIPFNNASYYHPDCPITNNATICWQGGGDIQLPDLRTEDADVRALFVTFITNLVTQYSIDGLRLDSALNVDVDFFTSFTKAADVFATGEVLSGVTADVCPYQGTIGSVLNYPIYFNLIQALSSTSGSFFALSQQMGSVKQSCSDTTVLGSFSENHDQPRFASITNDLSLAKNLLTYTMLTDGIPIIYEGQEQHYGGGATPANREAVWLSSYNTSSPLYNYITSLNVFRKVFSNHTSFLTSTSTPILNGTNTLALLKGSNGTQAVTVLNNDGAGGPSRNITLASSSTGFAAGDVLMDVVSCVQNTVDASGNLNVQIQGGMPSVFYKAALLSGTTVCKNGTTTLPAGALATVTASRSATASSTKGSKPTGSSGGSGSGSGGSGSSDVGRVEGATGAVVLATALALGLKTLLI